MKNKTIIISMSAFCIIILFVIGLFIYINKPIEETIFFHDDISNASFTNDLGITNIGDPFMLKISDNEYYMYCTSAGDGFYCWRSEDMVNWTDQTKCYTRERLSWGLDCFWAPEVVAYNDKYYMFYTAKSWTGTLRIGLAIADHPAGPFIDFQNTPLFDFGFAAIDANVLIDDDGSKYLYFSRDCSENIIDGKHVSQSYGVKLADDMKSVEGKPVLLTTPEQPWELLSGDYLWNEGPEVIKHGDTYYLSYSANYYASSDYSLGYATSKNPLGPFVKAEENPILSSKGRTDVSGTGHHSFVESPDGTELWIAYHSHTDVKHPSGDRKVNIAKAGFTEDGKLYINGPTTTPQPLPSGSRTTNITEHFKVSSPFAEKKNIVISLTDESQMNLDVSSIAIYGEKSELNNIFSFKLCVNGEFYSEEYLVTEEASSPIILSFDPVIANNIDIIITPKEGIEKIHLAEIELFSLN